MHTHRAGELCLHWQTEVWNFWTFELSFSFKAFFLHNLGLLHAVNYSTNRLWIAIINFVYAALYALLPKMYSELWEIIPFFSVLLVTILHLTLSYLSSLHSGSALSNAHEFPDMQTDLSPSSSPYTCSTQFRGVGSCFKGVFHAVFSLAYLRQHVFFLSGGTILFFLVNSYHKAV